MFTPQKSAIRNKGAEYNLFLRRAAIAFAGVCALMVLLIYNMVELQINSFEKYQTRSNDNRIKLLPVAPNRGLIYDRNGILLAENRPVFSLELVPEEIKDIKTTVDQLAGLIDISAEERDQFEKSVKAQRRFKSIILKNRLSEVQVARLSVNLHRFPGVSIEARLKRYYPYAEVLTHVLGYVAKINKKDLQAIEERDEAATYAATRDIGKLGIEKYYEQLLHGQPGFQEVEVNNRGKILRVLNYQPPVHGQDLYLNIDLRLQQTAFEELDGRRGSLVAVDPQNGHVLAMVSSPSYDPNLFVHGISGKDYRKLLSIDKPLINRATQGAYPPASTIKPIMALVALEEKIISENSSIFDPGWFKLPNVKRRFRDHWRPGHGKVDVYRALGKSCDTFFYDAAYRMGIDKISPFMYRFGFGEYTGVDIHEEKSAIMPSREWKEARHREPWYTGDTISLSIGQGYWTATPLQLANATAIVATKGRVFTPQILGASQGENGLLQIPAEDRPPVELEEDHNWEIVHRGMWETVNIARNTAFRAFKGAHYQSAGKTGTAQVIGMAENEKYDASKIDERLRDNAMYVGYAPFDNPQIAVSVAIENAGHGGEVAAPIARKVMDIYIPETAPADLVNQTANDSNEKI